MSAKQKNIDEQNLLSSKNLLQATFIYAGLNLNAEMDLPTQRKGEGD